MQTTATNTDRDRLTIVLPPDLRAEAARYAAHRDASLGWVLRRGLRCLLDHEREQAERASSPRQDGQDEPREARTTMAVRVSVAQRDRLRDEATRRGMTTAALVRELLSA